MSVISWIVLQVQRHYREIIIVLALLLVAGAMLSYCERKKQEKIDHIQSNIDQQKGVNSVIEVQRNTAIKELEDAQKNTNLATRELNNSIARPANQFDGNRANERYCRNFPTDPECRK